MSSIIKENYRYLHFRYLMPHLIEEGLLDFRDCADMKSAEDRFMSSLVQDPRYSVRVASCIVREKTHLGHQYVASLLSGVPGDRAIISASTKCRSQMQRNFRSIVQSASVLSLVPYLVQKELITLDEGTLLSNVASPEQAVMRLFGMLESKGPTAHYLFAQCLREETTQIQHAELYHRIVDSEASVDCCVKGDRATFERRTRALEFEENPMQSCSSGPKPLEPDSLLKGTKYSNRRLRFEHYYHNGQWDKVREEADECMKSSHLDVRVIGLLEMALSWIFRSDEDYSPVHCIERAQMVCQTINGNNKSFLLGRCEYLLSLYFRYQGDFDTARRHIEKARYYLFDVASGEDKSFAYYCHATLELECLNDESPPEKFKEVEHLFEKARDNARFAGLNILVVYADLQLSRLYIGTTHTKLTFTKDKDRLSMARNCLLRIEQQFDELDLRRKSLFYLSMADWSYSCNDVGCAIEHAHKASELAQDGGLPLEIEAAKKRAIIFSPIKTSSSMYIIVLIWLLVSSLLALPCIFMG